MNNFSYEPLWVFKTKEGEYQVPNLKACIFLIETTLKGPQKQKTEEEIKKKEAEIFFEMLGGNAGIAESLHSQQAVSFANVNGEPAPQDQD